MKKIMFATLTLVVFTFQFLFTSNLIANSSCIDFSPAIRTMFSASNNTNLDFFLTDKNSGIMFENNDKTLDAYFVDLLNNTHKKIDSYSLSNSSILWKICVKNVFYFDINTDGYDKLVSYNVNTGFKLLASNLDFSNSSSYIVYKGEIYLIASKDNIVYEYIIDAGKITHEKNLNDLGLNSTIFHVSSHDSTSNNIPYFEITLSDNSSYTLSTKDNLIRLKNSNSSIDSDPYIDSYICNNNSSNMVSIYHYKGKLSNSLITDNINETNTNLIYNSELGYNLGSIVYQDNGIVVFYLTNPNITLNKLIVLNSSTDKIVREINLSDFPDQNRVLSSYLSNSFSLINNTLTMHIYNSNLNCGFSVNLNSGTESQYFLDNGIDSSNNSSNLATKTFTNSYNNAIFIFIIIAVTFCFFVVLIAKSKKNVISKAKVVSIIDSKNCLVELIDHNSVPLGILIKCVCTNNYEVGSIFNISYIASSNIGTEIQYPL